MSLAYYAAEYFVEAIGQSPSLSISCDYVTYLYSSALKEVQTYLNNNAKGDLYFIFKKFPDVFVIKKGLVSLTDAFLFIYALKRSTARKVVKSSCGINDYYENAAVAFCNTVVSRYGPQHYLTLFRMLVSDSNQIIASHFRCYSSSDAYFFFLSHADAFIVSSCYVSLNTQSLLNVPEQNSENSKESKELMDSVYFLLTCFESLHYIELKQCISYVLKSAKDLLDKYSLIKQRKMFENMPKIKMDCFGFLSLNDMNVNISVSNDKKILLLLVCILAFEREMHFERIVRDVASGRSSVVSSLTNLPLDEQLQYFKRYSNYFNVSDKGNVSLLPSFICPICTFEGLSVSKNVQNNTSTIKSEMLYPSSELNSKFEKDSNSINKQPGISGRDILSSKSNETQEKVNICVKKIFAEMFSIKDVSENSKRRFVISVLFLLEIFQQLDHKRALKTLLHVFCDVKMSFCRLSEIDKLHFVKAFCEILNSKSVKRTKLNPTSMGEIAKEKILLFITYLLTDTLEMHFEKIAAEIINKKITQLSSSISKQFKFFKTFPVLIKIENNGYVSLTQSFDFVNSVVESYSHLLSRHAHKGNTVNKKGQESVSKGEKAIDSKEMAQLPSGLKNSVSPKKNEVLSKALKVLRKVKIETQVMFKMLYSASSLIRMHFKNALDSHIIEAYLLAFNDVYNYFHNLSFENRFNFVEECYNVIKSCNQETPSDNIHCVSAYQDGVLFCTYLIVKEKSMHFQKIVTNLKTLNINAPICEKTPSEQFKYFKQFSRFFDVDGDGFVTLKSSFNSVSSIVNSVISFKSRTPVKCKQINKQEQTTCSPSQKTVRQASLSPQGSLMVKVNENCSQSENSPEKEDVKNCQVIQVNQECTESESSFKNETRENSTNNLSQTEWDTKDIIIDLSVYMLSICNWPIETLCCKLSSCDLRNIQSYLSLLTVAEKQEIFKSHPNYFAVSTDGIVSLKENVVDTYNPKTKLSPTNISSCFSSKFEESADCVLQSRSESAMSSDVSVISDERELTLNLSNSSSKSQESSFDEVVYNIASEIEKLSLTEPVGMNSESGHSCCVEKCKIICDTATKVKTNVNFQSTSVTSECTSVISNSSQISPESGLSGKILQKDYKVLYYKLVKSCRLYQKLLGIKLNSCDTNSQETSKFQNKNACLSNPDNFKMSLDKETNISSGKCSELQVPGDCTHKHKITSEEVVTVESILSLFLKVFGGNNTAAASQDIKFNFTKPSFQHLQINKNSAESNKSNIFINRDTSKMSQSFPKSNTIDRDFDKFLSSKENKLSIKHIADNYATANRQAAEDFSELTISDKVLSNDILNRSISSIERKISSQTASNLLVANSSNYSDVSLCDNSHDAYISELIDSYLDNSKNESFTEDIPKSQNASAHQNAQIIDAAPCFHNRSKIHNNTDILKSNSQTGNVQNSAENISVPSTSKCNSVAKNSSFLTSASSFNRSEIRAINFFCVILENYKNYESGVSIAFLQEQLNLASSEVRSFMHSHFQDDMLSFFLKHRKVFCVSPVSHKICLVKD